MKVLTEKTAILNLVGDQIPAVKKLADKAHINTGMIVGSVLFVLGLIAMIF